MLLRFSLLLLHLLLGTHGGLSANPYASHTQDVDSKINKKTKKPHIIFMLVDDLGYNDMEWADQFGQIKSPKLVELRKESIALERYYVYRFCSPSRSTILTGRYPWHIGQHTTMNLDPMRKLPAVSMKNTSLYPMCLGNLDTPLGRSENGTKGFMKTSKRQLTGDLTSISATIQGPRSISRTRKWAQATAKASCLQRTILK